MKKVFSAWLWPLALAALTLGVLALAIKLAAPDESPLYALEVLWNGAFGSNVALAATSARALVLILYALGIVFSFRAGILNIGAEGQSRIGTCVAAALCVGAIGPSLAGIPLLGIPLVLIFGALAGAAWSLLAGVLRQWRGVPEVISTLMLNFVGLLLARYLVSDPTLLRGGSIFQQSDPLPAGLQLPGWGMTEFHSGVLLAVPVVLLAHAFLFHTAQGFSLRAVGLNPAAAETCGVRVNALSLRVFALTGALSGLAGALALLARGRMDADPSFPDYGYMAIAVALMADLKPLWVLPSAILFAGLEVGTRSMERNAGVAHDIVYVIEGVIILAILVRGVQVLRARGAGPHSAAEAAA